MKRNQNSQVKTNDGRTFFASNDALLGLYLAQAGNPTVVAVRMPSGAWSTNASLLAFYNK